MKYGIDSGFCVGSTSGDVLDVTKKCAVQLGEQICKDTGDSDVCQAVEIGKAVLASTANTDTTSTPQVNTNEVIRNQLKGMSLLEKKQKLETFGTDDGAFERIPVVATSVVYFDKGETISRKDFFREKNRENALPNTEFPLKAVAMEITSISVEADLNFAKDTQDSLKREFHFLKNSVLRTILQIKNITQLKLTQNGTMAPKV